MSYEMLGIIAGIIAIGGYIPYIYSILKGKSREPAYLQAFSRNKIDRQVGRNRF